MKRSIKLNAYHKWLLQAYGNNLLAIAAQLAMDCFSNNGMAWDTLKETGDTTCNSDNFIKAAQLIIDNYVDKRNHIRK